MNNKVTIGAFQVVMRSVVVISHLLYDMEAPAQSLAFFFLRKELKMLCHFWCFLSSHAHSMNEARHNNEPAHRHNK